MTMMFQNYDHIPMINTNIIQPENNIHNNINNNSNIINFIMDCKRKRKFMAKDVNLLSNETKITEFDIEIKYVPIKQIGKGAYGVVVSSFNSATNEKVAIKKITNVLGDAKEALKVVRELKILRHAQHKNIVSLKDVMVSSAKVEDIYLVFELMDYDLRNIIYSPRILSNQVIKYFMFQLINGLDHLHSANIIHCDLKPANLLVNEDCTLKICDFGLARTTKEADPVTNYIVTRWYRAPELLVNSSKPYGTPIDIWSVGCIFAELLGRTPIFPGTNTLDQINQILAILGTPRETDLRFVTDWKAFKFIRGIPEAHGLDPLSLFPNAELSGLDLLKKMLQFDPDKRITAKEALKHPYFSGLYDPKLTQAAPYPCEIDVDQDIAPNKIRNVIWSEIILYHHETAPYR